MARPKRKSTYNAKKRRETIIHLMNEAQNAFTELEAAEKRVKILVDSANKYGINLTEIGSLTTNDQYTNMAWDSINFRNLSRILAGGDLNITRDNVPKKYAHEVHKLVKANERAFKNIFSQRFQKEKRKKQKAELLEKRKRMRKRNAIRK